MWYVRAADHGDERAKARLKIINNASIDGRGNVPRRASGSENGKGTKKGKHLTKENPAVAGEGAQKECIIM